MQKLSVNVSYKVQQDLILVEGSVVSIIPKDRVVNIRFGLPIVGKEWAWWENIDVSNPISSKRKCIFDTYPFCAIANRDRYN
jgi:hypothetical protein